MRKGDSGHEGSQLLKHMLAANSANAHWGQSETFGRRDSPYIVFAVVCLTMAGVFLADVYTPLGIAVWVFYLVPVVLTLFVWNPFVPALVAVVATVLIAVGYFFSTPGLSQSVAQTNRGFGVATVWMMALIGYYFIRGRLAVRREEWLQSAQTGLSKVMAGELPPRQLGENVLRFLCEYLDAQAGAFFVGEHSEFRRTAAYGVCGGGAPNASISTMVCSVKR